MNNGDVAILNCTDGDTRITFNSNNPGDVERAKHVVEDMLKRGYCLSVVVGDRMERVVAFDPTKSEYEVIDRGEPPAARGAGSELNKDDVTKAMVPYKAPRRRRVSAKQARVVAVGGTAGGGLGCQHFGFSLAQLRAAASGCL